MYCQPGCRQPAIGINLRVQYPPCWGFRGAPDVPFLCSPPQAASKMRKKGCSGNNCPPENVMRWRGHADPGGPFSILSYKRGCILQGSRSVCNNWHKLSKPRAYATPPSAWASLLRPMTCAAASFRRISLRGPNPGNLRMRC